MPPPKTLGLEPELGQSLPHPQSSSELPAQPPSRCHLHMTSLVGHHEGRREAILMVKGTASQRVAHASDRGIPCERGEGRGSDAP